MSDKYMSDKYMSDKCKHIIILKFTTFLLIISILTGVFLAGCNEEPAIGDIVNMAPVTALVFDKINIGGQTSEGVFYREVNNIDKLIASNEALLIAFLDHNPPSSESIPFLEIMCDDFSGKLQIVRVNVETFENDEDVEYLRSLFNVRGYPFFVLVSKGIKINEFEGYDEELREIIIGGISEFVYR